MKKTCSYKIFNSSLKKSFSAVILAAMCCVPVFAGAEDSSEDEEDSHYEYVIGEVVIPAAKRPKKITDDELMESESRNEEHANDEYVQKCNDTFLYGLESEISTLIDELTKEEDLRFVDPIYDLFYVTKNPAIRQKILAYFTALKDPCLEDYAVTILDDPYDERRDIVTACFAYVSAVECKAAVPCLVKLLDKEEEAYFNSALSTLGDIGGADEALYLADYLDRDDLTTAQRQSLMKVLGKIRAVETWDKLSEIAQDEDENSFVRMYAAEAIGAMQIPESEDILIDLFEVDDPNFRVYVIKGISHFDDQKADNLILQGLRDSQWKVRLEAVEAASSRNMQSAVPYLVYRCKDSSEEKNVKNKCYSVIAKLNTQAGNEYLVSVITDKKASDTTKATVAAALLEYNNAGTSEIIQLAEESLTKDQQKNLRYALGKEFAKWGRPEYEEICAKYIASSDVATQGTGLDIFAKGKYEGVRPAVETIAAQTGESTDGTSSSSSSTRKNANAAKAQRILQRIDSMNGTLGQEKTEASEASESQEDTNASLSLFSDVSSVPEK